MRHQPQECRSKNGCDRLPSNDQMMPVTDDHEGSVIYPVVAVVVDGIKCRALLDTGAGSSYASAALVEQIEVMLCSTIQKVRGNTVKVASVDRKFEMSTKVI